MKVVLFKDLVKKADDPLVLNFVWIAQCVEKDICAQGETIKQVVERMKRTLDAYETLSCEKEIDLIGGLPVAPKKFETMYEDGVEVRFTFPCDYSYHKYTKGYHRLYSTSMEIRIAQ